MNIQPHEAAASLRQVADTERRVRQQIGYAVSSSMLMLWGVLSAIGYAATHLYPQAGRWVWGGATLFGVAGTAYYLYRHRRARPHDAADWRLLYAMIVLVAYGGVCEAIIAPLPGRQESAFWSSLFMLGLVLAGIWFGRVFIVCGVLGIGLVLFGHFALGSWFYLWMAAVQGGTLLVAGIWLRRLTSSVQAS